MASSTERRSSWCTRPRSRPRRMRSRERASFGESSPSTTRLTALPRPAASSIRRSALAMWNCMISSRATAAATSSSRRFARLNLRGERPVSESIEIYAPARGKTPRGIASVIPGAPPVCIRAGRSVEGKVHQQVAYNSFARPPSAEEQRAMLPFSHRLFLFPHHNASRPAPALLRRSGKMTTKGRLSRRVTPLMLCALIATGAAVQQLPRPVGYVNDFANIIPPARRAEIERIITEVRQKSGGEMVVVTMRSLEGRPANEVALRLGREWGVGRAGEPGDPARNTGLIILVVPKETSPTGRGELRIETGLGTNTFITAAEAGRIADLHMIPAFRAGDYGTG